MGCPDSIPNPSMMTADHSVDEQEKIEVALVYFQSVAMYLHGEEIDKAKQSLTTKNFGYVGDLAKLKAMGQVDENVAYFHAEGSDDKGPVFLVVPGGAAAQKTLEEIGFTRSTHGLL